MKPYLPYARVSSDEQRDAETIKTQVGAVTRFFESQGLALGEWCEDDGVTGMTPFHERPGGARALALLRTGAYAGLACLNHKRIGREAYVIHLAVKQIEQELRLDILAVREPVPSAATPGARAIMRAVYAGVAQGDREEFLANARDGQIRAAKEGRWLGGKAPFGYRVESLRPAGRGRPVKRLAVDPEQSEIVAEIYSMCAEGLSQHRIAEVLTARGVPHPLAWQEGRRGHVPPRWYQGTVSEILRNTVYAGGGSWGKVEYEDYKAPALVTPALWKRCAERRRDNLILAARNARRFYLLRTLVRCGRCGRNFNGTGSAGRTPYYQCNSQMRGRKDEHCGNRAVRAAELEEAVWRRALRFLRDPGEALSDVRAAYALLGDAREGGAAAHVERLIARKGDESARLVTALRKGQIDEAEFARERDAIRAEVEALGRERERLAGLRAHAEGARALRGRLEDLAARAEGLSPEGKYKVLREFVRGVVVNSDDGERAVRAEAVFGIPRSDDIACARHFGARAVGVGTGRLNNLATLAPHSPDALLPDLSDTGLVMRTLDAL